MGSRSSAKKEGVHYKMWGSHKFTCKNAEESAKNDWFLVAK